MNILVVEDDIYLARAYITKLKNEHFTVELATDGEAAMTILKTFRPDVVILDILMPKKDGFATLEEMKKRDDLKDIPVVVLSNLDQKEAIERARRMGAVDYFAKTEMSLDNLVNTLKQYAPNSNTEQ
ncbi:MAG TPA: response regulator [Candidatus Saccharimonadales bacterium]|nr:response regulator [Candidatus Saccharimonadales bacterium]